MAQIDLKRCLITMRDGYTGSITGSLLVANSGGYSGGATVMTVDGATGPVTTGDSIVIAGETPAGTIHTITAHTETLGNTTSITFTPALQGAVADDAVITTQPHQLMLRIGEGTLTFDEKKNRIYVKDRGLLYTLRDGDEDPMEVKLEFIWEYLKADSGLPPTFEDFLKQRGNASAYVTSGTDPCEPYCVDILIVFTPFCADDKFEDYLLPEFRYETLNHDFKQGMVNCTGKCNVIEATVSRVARS